MTAYITEPHTTIFTGPPGCEKTHLVLDLIEKKLSKHFDYIITISLTLRWNKTYHSEDCIKNNDKVWLIEPMDRLYWWIGKFSEQSAEQSTGPCHCQENIEEFKNGLLITIVTATTLVIFCALRAVDVGQPKALLISTAVICLLPFPM